MWTLALGILNWFSSSAFQSLASALVSVINKRSDIDLAKFQAATGAERDTLLARISADSAAYHDRVALMAGFGWAQFLIVLALAPAIAHEGLVFLDSLCPGTCGFHVPRLPPVYEEREWALIASLLGIQTAMAGAGSFLRWLHK